MRDFLALVAILMTAACVIVGCVESKSAPRFSDDTIECATSQAFQKANVYTNGNEPLPVHYDEGAVLCLKRYNHAKEALERLKK